VQSSPQRHPGEGRDPRELPNEENRDAARPRHVTYLTFGGLPWVPTSVGMTKVKSKSVLLAR
jgi:hypothetical protein